MDEKKDGIFDAAVIGAGAAGLMTAIMCARRGLRVVLLDGKEKIGAKILMSGGTRCNVTNVRVTERDFHSGMPRKVRNILRAFPPARAIEFFKSIGVDLVEEEGGKLFPVTHSGRTVLEALVKETRRLGIKLVPGCKITRLKFENGLFEIETANFSARTVVLCTGGLSYPATGSDGTGYEIARSFGHGMVPTCPALTPLRSEDAVWKRLSGVALPVRLSLLTDGRREAEYEGPFLFTHFGFSGPAALNISRHWVRAGGKKPPVLKVSFLPGLHEESLRTLFLDRVKKNPSLQVRRFLSEYLPERFAEAVMERNRVAPQTVLAHLTREDRETLIRALLAAELQVSGVVGYQKAEVTAGGVDLADVDGATLESKLRPGLFFAGEILDVDGRIGGFNFQWAWASGTAAAEGAAARSAAGSGAA